MLLAIDVGNTNIVLGLYDGESLTRSWRIKTDAYATADEYAIQIKALTANSPQITGIALCSTVPSVLREMREMIKRDYSEIKTVIVEPGIKTGVSVSTDNPKEVGTDRIMNSLAIFHRHGGPAIVVDFGTSTNLDVINANGDFIGGALAPGIEISIDALANRAAALRKIELQKPRAAVGRNTVEALQSGAYFGFAGQVDRLVTQIISEIGPVKAVVATGGLASTVVEACSTITHLEPDLTLEGLRLVFERN
ncbi:MAG: type III pantothenate kinase [Actinobacteria bacterium]|nr:type III pantothenate kinase [Actinomycetota bacterium]